MRSRAGICFAYGCDAYTHVALHTYGVSESYGLVAPPLEIDRRVVYRAFEGMKGLLVRSKGWFYDGILSSY